MSRSGLLAASFVAVAAIPGSLVLAQEGADGPARGFERSVETFAPIRLESREGPQIVDVFLHLWSVPSETTGSDAAPRTLSVVAETPPAFVRGLRILQVEESEDGRAERLTSSSTVTFAPGETARRLRLELEVDMTAAVAADDTGLASGRLVLLITADDPAIVPRSRRLVLPLGVRLGDVTPETTDARVQVLTRTAEESGGGRGFLASAHTLRLSWEDPTPQNSHCYSGFEPYVRLTWSEAVPGVVVVARGRVTGGIPPVDIALEQRGGGANPFHARFRDGHELNVRLPLGDVRNAGTLGVTGKLLAFSSGDDREFGDESRAVAVLPFEATLTRAVPSIEAEPKLHLHRARGELTGTIALRNVQPGRRRARVDVGGMTHFDLLKPSGRSCRVRVELHGLTSVPTSATVTFANFGEVSTVTVPIECEVSGTPPEPSTAELAELERRLSEALGDPARLPDVASLRRNVVRYHDDHRYFAPSVWARACDEHFDALGRAAAAVGDPNWIGWNRRGLAAKDFDRKRREVLYDRLTTRLYRAREACALRLIDVARRWVDASAGEVDDVVDDPGRRRSALGSVATAYSALAEATYHATGDEDAARALWRTYEDLRRRNARNPSTYTPSEFPFVEDEEYRR